MQQHEPSVSKYRSVHLQTGAPETPLGSTESPNLQTLNALLDPVDKTPISTPETP